jgi:hypothetical protein
MFNVIKQISNKNMREISELVKQNSDCYDSKSKTNDIYIRIISNSMSGGTVLHILIFQNLII